MSIFFGLLFACRFYCRSALSLSPGRTGGLFPRINAPTKETVSNETVSNFYVKLLCALRPAPGNIHTVTA